MYIRVGFVTNSSSVAFIAWGYIVEDLPKAIKVPEDVGVVRLCFNEGGYGYVYATSSRKMNLFGGETDPFYFGDTVLVFPQDADMRWQKQLESFCQSNGLEISEKLPSWFWAHYETCDEEERYNVV